MGGSGGPELSKPLLGMRLPVGEEEGGGGLADAGESGCIEERNVCCSARVGLCLLCPFSPSLALLPPPPSPYTHTHTHTHAYLLLSQFGDEDV